MIKMSYKGISFDVNPSSIRIDYSKKIATKTSLFSTSNAQEVSIEPTRITGSGRLVGSNARELAASLSRLFRSQGSGYLFVPDGVPVKAFFKSLNISYDSKESSVSYTFEFVEDYNGKKVEHGFGYTFAKSGESLYDIAYRTETDLDKLFSNNDFCDMFSVKEGDKVWLQ